MAPTIRVRNWDRWQSYRRDRGQPPWIKVHREIMRNVEWVSLTDAQRGQLVAIWLLAADHDGVIPASPTIIKKLCFLDSEPDIKLLISLGFLEGDANVTPVRRQRDVTETETETKKETESGGKPPKAEKSPRQPDLIFEAIAAACGIDWKALTKNERGALNNAASQLKALNVTPEDIQARAAKYRQKWPGIDMTPMALVNNWNTVIAAPEQASCQIAQLKAPPHMKQPDYDALDRHGKLGAWEQWGEMWEQRKRAGGASNEHSSNSN